MKFPTREEFIKIVEEVAATPPDPKSEVVTFLRDSIDVGRIVETKVRMFKELSSSMPSAEAASIVEASFLMMILKVLYQYNLPQKCEICDAVPTEQCWNCGNWARS